MVFGPRQLRSSQLHQQLQRSDRVVRIPAMTKPYCHEDNQNQIHYLFHM